MKFEVISISYVEAPDWQTAETAVEHKLVEPHEITSKPALKTSESYVEYGIQKKILKDQADLYYKDPAYEVSVEELKEKSKIWILNILEKCFEKNEGHWK